MFHSLAACFAENPNMPMRIIDPFIYLQTLEHWFAFINAVFNKNTIFNHIDSNRIRMIRTKNLCVIKHRWVTTEKNNYVLLPLGLLKQSSLFLQQYFSPFDWLYFCLKCRDNIFLCAGNISQRTPHKWKNNEMQAMANIKPTFDSLGNTFIYIC